MSSTSIEASATVDAGLHPAAEDPFATLRELMSQLVAAVESEDWLDAFLCAAGAVQIVEDRLDGVAWPPRRLLAHYGDGTPLLRAAHRRLDAAGAAYRTTGPARSLREWCASAAALGERLAAVVVADDPVAAAEPERAGLRVAARALAAGPGRAAGLLVRRDLLRPPACFCSFDQHPLDALALARRFDAAHPDPARPLLVLGVRTSGSYLAPLLGAALRRLGHRAVTVATTRPGLPLPAAATAPGRYVLVVDDPPVTGGSLATVAETLERRGLPTASIVPVFAAFDVGDTLDVSDISDVGDINGTGDAFDLPKRLSRFPCVVLPGRDWHVPTLLSGVSLRAALPALLPADMRLVSVRSAEPGPVARSIHLAVPLFAQVELDGGERQELSLSAEWAGVGRFGRRAVTAAQALSGLVAPVLGHADGVLVRERLPGEDQQDEDPHARSEPAPEVVARYAAARRERLAVAEDRSGRLGGRDPVWESAARLLAPVLGRTAPLLRPVLVQPLTRSLLSAERPCLVDGRTARHHWVADGHGGWAKTAPAAGGGFGNLDLACYDAAYDLAGAVAHGPLDDAWANELLDAYRKLTGRPVESARWCLFQLVQARNAVRLAAADGLPDTPALRSQARRAQARAVQRFLADIYLADLDDAAPRGGWCVLDVDGVLETDVLGFPAASPQSMLALRALRAHGHRTLLATGRSLAEVRDRCAAYRLAGGVAEYGAVCWDAASGRIRVALPEARRLEGDGGLRARLAGLPDTEPDPLYQWCVRASVRRNGRRTGLAPEQTAALLREEPLGRLFEAVPGDAQTDFVPRGADKAAGVRALLELMGDPRAVPLLAVGDTAPDLPMLRWARHAGAPGHAAALRAHGVPLARRDYQAGLADIVAGLLGHRPGGCPICRAPRPSPQARALLAALAVPEAGRAGAPGRLARLAAAEAALLVTSGGARR